tara:strand:+ start:401 stop:517 length:117 start_codon:yes stop_codon:yes gene_type:complete
MNLFNVESLIGLVVERIDEKTLLTYHIGSVSLIIIGEC